eukprot:655350-Prorocentrum_minimum.AAC.1
MERPDVHDVHLEETECLAGGRSGGSEGVHETFQIEDAAERQGDGDSGAPVGSIPLRSVLLHVEGCRYARYDDGLTPLHRP